MLLYKRMLPTVLPLSCNSQRYNRLRFGRDLLIARDIDFQPICLSLLSGMVQYPNSVGFFLKEIFFVLILSAFNKFSFRILDFFVCVFGCAFGKG